MQKNNPEYIIAIGASAGGMEEINAFFDHTPLDSVSYVIIQHLSPDFKSRMVELLSRHSKLLVLEAEEGLEVQSNTVYLIPNNQYMTIEGNRLRLTPKENSRRPHLTVNTFLKSLAINSGKHAIAVILSGLGTDGTEGTKAIKKAGGMVIARNPEETEFSSMPSNAIATGLVDFVLEPEQMPVAIQDFITHADKLMADIKEDEQYILPIVEVIKDQLPLDFTEYKQTTILRRIKRRAAHSNFTTLKGYLEFLNTAPEEVELLAKDFLISVTTFFRDSDAFENIAGAVLPAILKDHHPEDELKLWIAGCATGEEAYSVAILLCEQLTGALQNTAVKIFATDIDAEALAIGSKGIYHASLTKNISPERLEKYFIPEGDCYRVSPAIRKMVIFAQHDLVKNPPYCNMSFISCRNVLIYMTPALQKKIYAMLLFGLKANGYLFLGSSENPLPILQNLEVTDPKSKIYKSLNGKRLIKFDAFSIPELQEIKRLPASATKAETNTGNDELLAETLQATLAKEMGYLVVCVNEHHQVIKSYGDTSRFLHQKLFNNNIMELLPKPLAIAFNTVSRQALQANEKVTAPGIQINQGGKGVFVNLSVVPLHIKRNAPPLLMAIFTEDTTTPKSELQENTYNEDAYLNDYTFHLEEELQETKLQLRAAYEKLDALNENMHSFNEELLSANEEMQSTNEEMQSVNEELHTINTDYHLKNKELQELNDDLNNYFKSNVNGQLFVDSELRLLKFSPAAVKLINLMEGDVGRPLSNISTNIRFDTIIQDIQSVLSKGVVLSKDIESNDGQWYQLMTMPYLTQADNRITGAILTFTDITKLKRIQASLDRKNKSLNRINEDLEHFVFAASHDLLAPLGNIQTSIEIMNRIPIGDEKLTEFLGVINYSVKKFSQLIKDIAVIAEVESDVNAHERVDINELIDNIEWSLENKIKAAGATIKRNILTPYLPFSKKNLRSIVFNLVSNGIKFRREEPPEIYIACWKEEDQLILCVQDNGKGIPESSIKKIFEMYGRLHQNIEGSGIGLYLAKKIVNAAGGNMVVESEVGKGSKFIIYLSAYIDDENL
ncbi:chemotaxis protein CheR [Mucilaginibacter robiniae]|uniref:histidine kinase n=1 Tax=Mucilaginibacter robiniae TaxID=2728022 RepID=A0A7L5E2D2_9SPHI|nr:chemotaxis protein CheB [Mucilaginibacter robiniae]QJD97191.1 chemotaxis protein CheR [Mucilaginibacter robiniae]